jgi:hypothetical protein
VLLKNDGILPLAPSGKKRIAVIGGWGNLGTLLGGGGSSLMTPTGGTSLEFPLGGEGLISSLFRLKFIAPGPVDAIRKEWPDAEVIYNAGLFPAQAAALARRVDLVILNGIRFEGEGYDLPDMSLPWGQDALFDVVLNANPNGVVILQTGSPVAMPWRNKARAVIQAWYQGHAGATALAEIITGKVNPGGRLAMTWYADVEQTPHAVLVGSDIAPESADSVVTYQEGAEIGYRWLAKTGQTPLFPFGHGLSYTRFGYSDFKATGRRHGQGFLHGDEHRRARRRGRAAGLPLRGSQREAPATAGFRARRARAGRIPYGVVGSRSAAAGALRRGHGPLADREGLAPYRARQERHRRPGQRGGGARGPRLRPVTGSYRSR